VAVGPAIENDSAVGITAVGGITPVVTAQQPTGGWRKRYEQPEPPSAEEVRKQREALGILPKKARQAVQKVVERTLAEAAADDESLRQALSGAVSGSLQRKAERSLRNELAARKQKFVAEMPTMLDAILRDGLARAAQREMMAEQQMMSARQEEAEVNEILALFLEM
jgi:hypothetical protein